MKRDDNMCIEKQHENVTRGHISYEHLHNVPDPIPEQDGDLTVIKGATQHGFTALEQALLDEGQVTSSK